MTLDARNVKCRVPFFIQSLHVRAIRNCVAHAVCIANVTSVV
jgi:hypothetical protein